MSSYRNIDEPIFFTPPTNQPDGRRTLYKGGGGGSSGAREATEEEKRLWTLQGNSLESLNAISMPMLETGMNNLGSMANESMDGTMAARLRDTAGADVSSSFANQRDQQARQMASMGINPNSGAWANNDSKMRMSEAAANVGAKGMANMAAEDVKWQRNAALTGMASGQGAQSVSGMGSLSAQIGQNRANSNAMDMQDQQSQYNSIAGLAMGGKMMGMYKDGGAVTKAVKGGIRFSGGGQLQTFKPASMPTFKPFSASASSKPQADGGMLATAANVAVPAMGINMAATGLDKMGISAPKQAIDGLVNAGKDTVTNALGITQGATPIASGAGAAGTTGLAVMEGGAPIMAAEYAAPAIATEAAAAGTAAGSGGLMAAAGTAMPWLAAGYAVGSMLDLWADGGDVRKDMTPGGKVSGPGTGTSDSVDAKLSDGEIVANTAAVGLGKSETQKVIQEWQGTGKGARDLLLAINDKGLEKRYGKDKARANPRYEGGAQKMALGGIASALGNGLFKAAPMMNQIDEQRATDAYRQKQDARADASEARTAATYGLMLEDRTEKKAKDAKVAEIMGNWSGNMRQMGEATQALQSGKMSSQDFATAIAPHYSKLIKDGKVLQPLADGSFSLTEDGGNMTKSTLLSADDTAKYLSSSEMFMKARRQMYEELAAVNPDYAAKADTMLGHELEASRDARNFSRQERRDNTADEQWNKTFTQQGDHYKATERNRAAELGIRQSEYNTTSAEKKAKAEAAVAIFKQNNPGATPEQLEAVVRGIIAAVPDDVKDNFTFTADPMGGGGTVFNKSTGGGFTLDKEGNKGSVFGNTHALGGEIAAPKNQAEFDKLSPGTLYVDPSDGKKYTKPGTNPAPQNQTVGAQPQAQPGNAAKTVAAQGIKPQSYRDLSENAVNRNAVKLIASDVGDVFSGKLREEQRRKREDDAKRVRGY